MSDTAITTVISKTHVTIVTILSIIGVSSFLVFLTLQEGVMIDRLLLPGFKIEQLYIKWNEKLSLTADEIVIDKAKHKREDTFDPKLIRRLFGSIKYFEDWVEHIAITQMLIGDNNVTFRYTSGKGADLDLTSKSMRANARLTWDEPYFQADLTFRDASRDIDINGTTVVDLDTLIAYSRLHIIPARSADLTLYLQADEEQLTFATRSNAPITRLRPIVDLFGLHKDVTPWIVDYSFGSTFELHALRGSLSYDDPGRLLHTLHAEATYHDFIYKFQSGLPPIRTSSTDFVFDHGVLGVHPHDAYYLEHRTGKSWLNIDLNDLHDPVLNAFIVTTSRFDKGLVQLLDYFRIPLPFVQTEGTVDADLTLNIPLMHVRDLQANGDFILKDGTVEYKDIPLKVTDSAIAIRNSSVDVKKVNIDHDNRLKASAKGTMDFSKGESDLTIDIKKAVIADGASRLRLDTKKCQMTIDYVLTPKHESVSFSHSVWSFDDKDIDIKAFTAPFDFDKASIVLPKVSASIQHIADISVRGPIDLQNEKADLKIGIRRFHIDGLTLKHRHFPFTLHLDDALTIQSDLEVSLEYFGTPIMIGPTAFTLADDQLTLSNDGFAIADNVEGALDGLYDIKTRQGTFDIHGLTLSNKRHGDMFYAGDSIAFDLFQEGEKMHATASDLALYLTSDHDGWSIDISDLQSVAKYSKFMQAERINSGRLTLTSSKGQDAIGFNGSIDYPYAILVKDGIPRHDITFAGTYTEPMTTIDLLDDVHVTLGKKIAIRSNGIGFNSDALVKFIHDHHDDDANTTGFPDISLIADNSLIYFSDSSKALADTITVDMYKNSLTASLIHHKGSAIFELIDGDFYADGQNFDDEFMTALFATSRYEGGTLLFNVSGTLDHAQGQIYIENTIMKDYKTLNNILAFINTVPSLVTFSLPSYATTGIKVTEAYANFTYKDDKMYFDSMNFDSPEMKIIGNGIVDYLNNMIDMNMTFKTDLGTTISKVPVVGYLLLGEDGSIATSFKVTGKMDDPSVQTQTVQDIVTAPFNIIKRAVTLPFWIFDSD